jgi:hypothetical protein
VIQYNASGVPVIQLAPSGKTLFEAQLYDYGLYRIRQQLAPIQGVTLPLPYGGKPRQMTAGGGRGRRSDCPLQGGGRWPGLRLDH